MRILLIMPLSYGYYKTIIKVLTDRGDNVSFIPDFDESILKRLLRKLISIKSMQNQYIQNEISKFRGVDFDKIIIIRGYYFSQSTIVLMKNLYCNSEFILYQWDPLSISNFDQKALKEFDRLYSFDRMDCKKYNMSYLPLFYSSLASSKTIEKDLNLGTNICYDFSFVGSGHSQRLFVLKELIKAFKSNNYTYFIRVYINKYRFYYGVLLNKTGYRNFPKENLSFKPIPKYLADDIVKHSKIVVDIHHPLQTGLSIRVMEVLGAGKKIITTNKSIVEESFYNKDVMGIIENCQLPYNIEELLKDKKEVDVTSFEVNNWIFHLIPFDEKKEFNNRKKNDTKCMSKI